MWKFYSWLAVALLFATGPPGARADYALFTYFNTSNPNVTSPYAEVTINNKSADVIEFKLTDYGSNSATFRNFGFDLNGVAASHITAVTVNGSSASFDTGSNMDGFGSFDVMVKPGAKLSSETIDVTFNTSVSPSSVEKLNAGGGNGPGFYYAAEYFPTGNTGFIGTDTITPTATPAPPGLVLALTGCGALGLFCLARRRKVIALT